VTCMCVHWDSPRPTPETSVTNRSSYRLFSHLCPTQDLLESPHVTLELMSFMDMLPKNLDTVSACFRGDEGQSFSRTGCLWFRNACMCCECGAGGILVGQ